MKKNVVTKTSDWKMRKEYDLSNSRPNKYAKKYAEGTNIVLIEPDLVEFFPASESVNTVLRTLVSILHKSKLKEKPKKGTLTLTLHKAMA
jgi:hypothetical protein